MTLPVFHARGNSTVLNVMCVAGEIFPEVNLGRRSRHHESPRLVASLGAALRKLSGGCVDTGGGLWRDEDIESIPSILQSGRSGLINVFSVTTVPDVIERKCR